MDVTSTAQVISQVSGAVANSGGFDPTTLTALGGVLMSHMTEPLSNKIPDNVKPYAIGAAHIAIGAYAKSAVTNTPFAQNLGAGLAAAGIAAIYHSAIFKQDGFLANLFKGALNKA